MVKGDNLKERSILFPRLSPIHVRDTNENQKILFLNKNINEELNIISSKLYVNLTKSNCEEPYNVLSDNKLIFSTIRVNTIELISHRKNVFEKIHLTYFLQLTINL